MPTDLWGRLAIGLAALAVLVPLFVVLWRTQTRGPGPSDYDHLDPEPYIPEPPPAPVVTLPTIDEGAGHPPTQADKTAKAGKRAGKKPPPA